MQDLTNSLGSTLPQCPRPIPDPPHPRRHLPNPVICPHRKLFKNIILVQNTNLIGNDGTIQQRILWPHQPHHARHHYEEQDQQLGSRHARWTNSCIWNRTLQTLFEEFAKGETEERVLQLWVHGLMETFRKDQAKYEKLGWDLWMSYHDITEQHMIEAFKCCNLGVLGPEWYERSFLIVFVCVCSRALAPFLPRLGSISSNDFPKVMSEDCEPMQIAFTLWLLIVALPRNINLSLMQEALIVF